MMNDLRYAFRQLLKNPGSTVMVVVILALGIGSTTAIFSAVDKVILNPIPGRHPDRLIALQEVDVLHDARWRVSPPLFAELCTHTNTFDSLVAFEQFQTSLTLDKGGTTVKLTGTATTPGFFDTLGVRPLAGRSFLPTEGRLGTDGVLVASYGLWQQHFGGDPVLVGRTITLDGRPYTVVGIMPPNFQFPFRPGDNQFWLPRLFTAEQTNDPGYNMARQYDVIGRLRHGVSLEQARALLNTVAQQREKDHPESNKKWTIVAKPAQTMFVGSTLVRTLWSLQAAVLMLLLISCANVGMLLLSRAVARRGEFAIRLAIGAGRIRVTSHASSSGAVDDWCLTEWFWEEWLRSRSRIMWKVCCMR